MPEGANTPNRYVMHSMTISNNEGYQLDIKQIYQDFMISESIYSNHIGGYVTVIDGSNVFNRIGFTGQEYIRIHFSGIEGIDTEVPFEEQVDITCRIHKVSAMKKTTDGNTRQYKLYFISPQSIASKRKRLSKAYSGSLSDISAKILKNELGIQDSSDKTTDGRWMSVRQQSEPQNYHVVVPNYTVNNTLDWLVHNMSVEEGSTRDSFYLYQTARNGYRLHTVEDMMGIKYLNGEVVFGEPLGGTGDKDATYDDGEGQGEEGRPGPGMDIYDINQVEMFNTEQNTTDGVYSGKRITYNPTLKLYQEIEYSILGQEEYKLNGDGEWEGGTHISKAPPFRIGNESYRQPSDGTEGEGDMGIAMTIEGLESIITYKDAVVDFGYEPQFNINGVNKNTISLHQDTGLHNFRRNSVKKILDTNTMNIVISGRTNINAGMVINLDLKQPIPGGEEEPEILQNGEMLITALSFQGTKDELVCQLTCSTDGAEVNIDGYDAPPVPPNEGLEGQMTS